MVILPLLLLMQSILPQLLFDVLCVVKDKRTFEWVMDHKVCTSDVFLPLIVPSFMSAPKPTRGVLFKHTHGRTPCHQCHRPPHEATPSSISPAQRQKRPTSSQRRRPCRRRPRRPIAPHPGRSRSAGAGSLPVTTYEHQHPPDAPRHLTPAPEAGSTPR